MAGRPPGPALFPSTTLFRSRRGGPQALRTAIARHGQSPVDRHAIAHGERWRFEEIEEHTSELQSHSDLVCRLLLEKKKITDYPTLTPSGVRTPQLLLSPRPC